MARYSRDDAIKVKKELGLSTKKLREGRERDSKKRSADASSRSRSATKKMRVDPARKEDLEKQQQQVRQIHSKLVQCLTSEGLAVLVTKIMDNFTQTIRVNEPLAIIGNFVAKITKAAQEAEARQAEQASSPQTQKSKSIQSSPPDVATNTIPRAPSIQSSSSSSSSSVLHGQGKMSAADVLSLIKKQTTIKQLEDLIANKTDALLGSEVWHHKSLLDTRCDIIRTLHSKVQILKDPMVAERLLRQILDRACASDAQNAILLRESYSSSYSSSSSSSLAPAFSEDNSEAKDKTDAKAKSASALRRKGII